MKSFIKFGLLICFIFSVFGCKENGLEKAENNTNQQENIPNLDKILKCNDYIISEHETMFTTSYDYGCVYDPKGGNDIGNVLTYLIPKDFLFFQKHSKLIENGDYDKLEAFVNSLNIEEFKKQFDIYVFVIDKRYLKDTPKLDSPYNVKKKYQTDLYHFQENVWVKVDHFVSQEFGNENMDWRENFIEKKSNEQRTAFLNFISKSKIDDSWYRDYILPLDSYEPSYNYAYYMKISKDSCYVMERSVQDMLVPYQNADTLFLYHKESFPDGPKYLENKLIPELKIVKLKDKYYIQSPLFDLENSISNKPEKYGFLVDENKSEE